MRFSVATNGKFTVATNIFTWCDARGLELAQLSRARAAKADEARTEAVHHARANQVVAAATILAVRHRTRLAAYAAHPERFVQGPPRPETLPTAVWINRPPTLASEDAPGTTIVTPDDPQHGVIRRSQPISDDRSITLVSSVESLQ